MFVCQEGRVIRFRPISRTSVQLNLSNCKRLIELTIDEAWVINNGDKLFVAGEINNKTGKLMAYTYKNHSTGVTGQKHGFFIYGCHLIIVGFFLFWTIIPALILIHEGAKYITRSIDLKKANSMRDG